MRALFHIGARWKEVTTFLFILVGGSSLWIYSEYKSAEADVAAIVVARSGPYEVIEVVDGDTIKVEIRGEVEAIRLIGIDSPELFEAIPECFAEEAYIQARGLLLGTSVMLERDPSQDERDIYGRLLAYVITDNGQNFNWYMLEKGYAREYTHVSPYSLQQEFKQAEADAKASGLGMWGERVCEVG